MQTPFTLDKWDIALIRHFKGGTALFDLNTVLTIWAERCAVDVDPYHLVHVVSHLATLVERCNPIALPDLIERLSPERGWRYNLKPETPYVERWLAVFASHLALTEVVKLPGYREAIDAEKALTDAPGRAKMLAP